MTTPPQPTITSRVPQVIDWLVAAAQASPLLGGATPQVSVWDGVQPPGGSQEAPRSLWIAGDPSAPGDAVAEAEQEFGLLDKGRTRNESGSVALTAQFYSGSTDNKVNRDGAAAIVAGAEVLLRGDGRTGPGDCTMGGLVWWSEVSGPFAWQERQLSSGASCLVTFHVTWLARLTTG